MLGCSKDWRVAHVDTNPVFLENLEIRVTSNWKWNINVKVDVETYSAVPKLSNACNTCCFQQAIQARGKPCLPVHSTKARRTVIDQKTYPQENGLKQKQTKDFVWFNT